MIHISTFSGEGGFDLAAEWPGWRNMVSCEINPFCNQILSYYWPEAYHHTDIKTLTYQKINEELTKRHGSDWRSDNVILSGGFPCQPYSVAGKRLGKADDRHLWPEMLRLISEVRPANVLGENVGGLVSWNGGMVFDEVQADLEALGYEVTPFIIPACGVNAPHKRYRIWFIAFNPEFSTNGRNNAGESPGNGMELGGYKLETSGRQQSSDNIEPSSAYGNASNANNNGSHGPQDRQSHFERNDSITSGTNPAFKPSGCCSTTAGECDGAHPDDKGLQGRKFVRNPDKCRTHRNKQFARFLRSNWENFPTQPGVIRGDDGVSDRLDPAAVFAGISKRNKWNRASTYQRWREESIKAHGNAIVPQVAYQIFKVIEQMNKLNK